MKCLDVVKEDMREVGAREDCVFARYAGRIPCVNPTGKPKEAEEEVLSSK